MSLTKVAEQTRAMIITGAILFVLLIIGNIAFNYFSDLWTRLNPPEPPQPSLGHGYLPELRFPEDNMPEYQINDEIVSRVNEVNSYFLPVYPVYPARRQATFFSLDRAKERAAALGFILEPNQLDGTEYRWTRSNPVLATLDMDTVSNQFDLEVSWQTDPSFLSQAAQPSPQQAVEEIRRSLRSADFLYEDIEEGRVSTNLLKYQNGSLVEAISVSEAEFIEVDLYRKPISFDNRSYPIVTVYPDTGLAEGIVSSAREQGRRIIDLDYVYVGIDYSRPHTYPFITSTQARELLQQNYGYVSRPPESGSDQITIRRIRVGYLDPVFVHQEYLQPVYIFEGDDNAQVLVPAINPNYFESAQNQTQ